jgi:hypothetical protein
MSAHSPLADFDVVAGPAPSRPRPSAALPRAAERPDAEPPDAERPDIDRDMPAAAEAARESGGGPRQ